MVKIVKVGDRIRKLILLLLLLLIALYNCTKNPVTSIAPKDSIVYIPSGNMVFLIDSSKDQIVDSVIFDFRIKDLNLSPDKKILYLQKDYPYTTSFVEVDVNSRTILYEGENSSLYHTPDGKYLVYTSQGLRLFRASTHEVVYEDTVLVIGRPAFDFRNSIMFMVMADKRIIVFDYRRLRIIKFLNALSEQKFQEVFDILFSELDNNLYFSSYKSHFPKDYSYTCYIGNIDTKSDKIKTLEKLPSFWCGGFLYSSSINPKIFQLTSCYLCAVIPESIPFNLLGISQRTLEIISELEFNNASFSPFAMYLLDNGRKAYIMMNYWGAGVLIIDLEQNKIVGHIDLPMS